MLNRSRTWAAALLVATFFAGILVGAGIRTVWVSHTAASRSHGPDRMLASLTGELHLTPPQHDSVRAILQRHWARMNAAWEAVRPRFDTIRADMDSEVVRLLSPDQAVKYRDHVTRYRHQQDEQHSDSGKHR